MQKQTESEKQNNNKKTKPQKQQQQKNPEDIRWLLAKVDSASEDVRRLQNGGYHVHITAEGQESDAERCIPRSLSDPKTVPCCSNHRELSRAHTVTRR